MSDPFRDLARTMFTPNQARPQARSEATDGRLPEDPRGDWYQGILDEERQALKNWKKNGGPPCELCIQERDDHDRSGQPGKPPPVGAGLLCDLTTRHALCLHHAGYCWCNPSPDGYRQLIRDFHQGWEFAGFQSYGRHGLLMRFLIAEPPDQYDGETLDDFAQRVNLWERHMTETMSRYIGQFVLEEYPQVGAILGNEPDDTLMVHDYNEDPGP